MNLKIKELSHDKLIELIENLILEVNQLKELKEENQKLKAQLGLNSSNSSKPPSTDYFKKKQKITLSDKKLIKILEVNPIIKDIP